MHCTDLSGIEFTTSWAALGGLGFSSALSRFSPFPFSCSLSPGHSKNLVAQLNISGSREKPQILSPLLFAYLPVVVSRMVKVAEA